MKRERYTDITALPLKNGSEWFPTVSDFAEFTAAFPDLDLEAEFKKMRLWLLSNPTKRKTQKGIRAFVVRWMINSRRVVVKVPDFMKEDYIPPEEAADPELIEEIKRKQRAMKC